APGTVGEHREAEVTRDGETDTGEIDGAGIDSVRQGDEDRDGHGVRGVEEAGDPARLGVGDAPVCDESRQQRRPRVRADLGAHLGDARGGDGGGRVHRATASRRRSYQLDISSRASQDAEAPASSTTRPVPQPQWSTIQANTVGEAELTMRTGVA